MIKFHTEPHTFKIEKRLVGRIGDEHWYRIFKVCTTCGFEIEVIEI